jgi:type II secretory pathway component PulF
VTLLIFVSPVFENMFASANLALSLPRNIDA